MRAEGHAHQSPDERVDDEKWSRAQGRFTSRETDGVKRRFRTVDADDDGSG
jgi:hypothetical protein